MKTKNLVMVGSLIALWMLVGAVLQGSASEPPGGAPVIGDTEIWGEVVINCGGCGSFANYATLRVKRVVDCNINTKGVIWTSETNVCPAGGLTETDVLGMYFNLDLSDMGITGKPIIMKVKNFKREAAPNDSIYSFDAQIKGCTNCP